MKTLIEPSELELACGGSAQCTAQNPRGAKQTVMRQGAQRRRAQPVRPDEYTPITHAKDLHRKSDAMVRRLRSLK